jgi:hypothetical protein
VDGVGMVEEFRKSAREYRRVESLRVLELVKV